MLLSRDYVGYMAGEIVKRLVASNMIETSSASELAKKVRAAMQEEISIEDRLNEEVRQILTQYADDMRRAGASYQEMYKKVKGELAGQRKLILRLRQILAGHLCFAGRNEREDPIPTHATDPRKN